MKGTDDYPFAETAAARMLSDAIRLKQAEGVSLRKLAPMLGYKQATVLSHMANGRIPVPIAKATDIAVAVGLPQSEFLIAAMDQREPEAHTLLAAAPVDFGLTPNGFADELEEVAGRPLDALTTEQKEVIRKVVVDPSPARRWLSEAELPAVALLRRLRPGVEQNGLAPSDRALIADALSNRSEP
ncbi:MAG: hypothetical protein COC10_06175 [Sphingobium sp.]|nr:MAG: hypothetical protein COC10_06175 [Sphingobium sp.]